MRAAFLLTLAPLALALPAAAQTAVVAPDPVIDVTGHVEIDHGPTDVADVLRRPIDRDTVDTALVFTHEGAYATAVKCAARNRAGEPIGRAWTRVPARGVAILFASDLTDDTDAIGSVQCVSRPPVTASGFVLAPAGISDVPVQEPRRHNTKRIFYPVIATY